VFKQKDSKVSKLTEKLWRLQVREERLGRGVLFKGERRKATEKPLTTADFEALYIWQGMTDQQLLDKANEMGWLSHEYFGKLFPGKKTVDSEVMTAIRNVLDRVITYKKIPRPPKAKQTAEQFIKAAELKNLQTLFELDLAGQEIEETQLQIEKAIGELLDKSYNVVSKKGDSYVVERGALKLTIPKEYIVVQKFSEEGVRRIQMNELYKIENRIRVMAQRGTLNVAPRRAKIANAFDIVDKEIAQEMAKLESAKAKDTITEKKYVKRRDEIINSRVPRVYKVMSEMSHLGKPLIVLPSKGPSKDILASVKAGTITYQVGVDRYVKRITKAHKKEPRIQKQARIRKQLREDQDIVLIRTLRTPEGTWLPVKGNEETIKSVGKSLKSSPIIVGAVVEGKLTPRAKATVGVYPMIKDRWEQLRLIQIERIPVNLRPESFEGRPQPSAWAEGRYWEFVQSEDLASEDAIQTMLRAVQDIYNEGFALQETEEALRKSRMLMESS
jgi:hypothetical protein